MLFVRQHRGRRPRCVASVSMMVVMVVVGGRRGERSGGDLRSSQISGLEKPDRRFWHSNGRRTKDGASSSFALQRFVATAVATVDSRSTRTTPCPLGAALSRPLWGGPSPTAASRSSSRSRRRRRRLLLEVLPVSLASILARDLGPQRQHLLVGQPQQGQRFGSRSPTAGPPPPHTKSLSGGGGGHRASSSRSGAQPPPPPAPGPSPPSRTRDPALPPPPAPPAPRPAPPRAGAPPPCREGRSPPVEGRGSPDGGLRGLRGTRGRGQPPQERGPPCVVPPVGKKRPTPPDLPPGRGARAGPGSSPGGVPPNPKPLGPGGRPACLLQQHQYQLLVPLTPPLPLGPAAGLLLLRRWPHWRSRCACPGPPPAPAGWMGRPPRTHLHTAAGRPAGPCRRTRSPGPEPPPSVPPHRTTSRGNAG